MKEATMTIEGVKKPVGGGDDQDQKPKINEPKVNATSVREEQPDENQKLRRKIRRAEIDENHRIVREAKEKARVAHEAEETLKAQKTIFPLWTLEQILKEAIDNPNVYWLEPVGSFDLENSLDL